jgi:hypothetical protein
VRRWLVALAVAAMAAGTAWAASPAPAGPAATGLDGLMPAPPSLQQGNAPTLAERYPVLAYANFNVDALSTVGNGFQDPTGTAANVLASWWAGQLMVLVVGVAMLTVRLIEWTFSFDLAGPAGGPLTAVVQGLHDQVYVPLLPAALALLAIWLVWHVLARRRTMHGLQGAGWAAAAVAVAGVYFAAPAQVLGSVDGFTGDLSRALLASIGTADPGLANRSANPSFSQGDPADAELRLFADRYWRTFVYEPWGVASLGDPASGQRYGEELLAKQSNLPSNFDADFAGAPAQAQTWYSGRYGGYRLILVVLALVAVVLASVLCLVVAGTVVVSQLALLLLMMVAPLVLLAGIHPGAGRRMLTRLAEMAAGALLVRVLSAAFLAVLLVLSGLLDQAGSPFQGGDAVVAGGSWVVAAGLQVALLAAAFVYRKPFLRVFGQVASPRLALQHASEPGPARAVHSGMDWAARQVQQRGRRQVAQAATGRTAGSAGKSVAGRGAAVTAGKAARVATTVNPAGVALLALEAGKVGVRLAARGTRAMQGAAAPLVVGSARTPAKPSFSGSAPRRLPIFDTAPAPTPKAGANGGPPPPRPRHESRPAGRTYTHHRSGETTTLATKRIVLPGAWREARR